MGQEQRCMIVSANVMLLHCVIQVRNVLFCTPILQAEKAAFEEAEKKKEAEVLSSFIVNEIEYINVCDS